MLTRIVTGTLAAAVALAAILWREPWGLLALCLLVLVLGIREGLVLFRLPVQIGLAALVFVLPPILIDAESFVPWVLGFVWIVGNLTLFIRFPNEVRMVLGLSQWLVAGIVSAIFLHRQVAGDSSLAPNLLLLALVPLWVGDSLAYFIGKAFGKHKLAPNISPNKTWEGAIANLIGCLVTALAIGLWLNVPLLASIAVGLTTGILGQVGDLLQSRLKRQVDVKDSGSILPGHGGALDRLDSFLFSSYPSLLALYLLAPEMFHVKQWPW